MDYVSSISAIYFVFLILFGAYFVVNLFLAVLKLKFGKAQSALAGITHEPVVVRPASMLFANNKHACTRIDDSMHACTYSATGADQDHTASGWLCARRPPLQS